ncbi:LytTR family DNA-binding domain-containing protein [Sphingomonas sp. MMS24-J13]|uniref:LytTR family DNA-binding domain-containing protein n=1 Tax=Sphingomonas sp. MMS24-J13 TaxID=3238686 RepID=UPI0038501214
MRKLIREIGVMVVLAVILAAVGALGTFDRPIGSRLLVWLLLALGGYVCFRPVIATGTWLSRRAQLPRLAMIAVACLLASFPATIMVAFELGSPISSISMGQVAALFPSVLLIGAIATAIQLAVRGPIDGKAQPPEPIMQASDAHADVTELDDPSAPDAVVSPFLDQVPAAIAHGLLYIGNEDHYVRAYAMAGDALVLARMRDAVAGLGGIEGARVHRSWWVARAAVAEVIRRDRAVYLRLIDGREVPVARSMVAELKEAGWL